MQYSLTLIILTVIVVVFVMNFLTPEKKLEKKIDHLYGLRSEQFVREMSALLGPPIIAGNHVIALQNGQEIFPAMLAEIKKARQTICFETYIYWSGAIGQLLADSLCERANNGVLVKVLIDWVGSLKMESTLLTQMEKAGVEIIRYRPLHWYNLGRMNNRTHRKLLIIDGKIGFTGGVGIADQWNGNADDPNHWRDIHFQVDGPVVAQFQSAFNDNWIKANGTILNGKQYFVPLTPTGNHHAQLFLSSPAGGSESMHLMYLMAIAAAETSIDLQAAYFVPDALMTEALVIAAQKRQVKIRILVPGQHIDSDSVRLASKATWGHLLQTGIQLFEYQPTMMHNKMLIIDQFLVSVGSTNFDPRSFRLNDEASLNIYNEEFAVNMTRVFEKDLHLAREYTYSDWLARPIKEKIFEKLILPIKSQL